MNQSFSKSGILDPTFSCKIVKDKIMFLKIKDCFGCKQKNVYLTCNETLHDFFYYHIAVKQLVTEGEIDCCF